MGEISGYAPPSERPDLVGELTDTQNLGIAPTATVRGGPSQGIYVCKELATCRGSHSGGGISPPPCNAFRSAAFTASTVPPVPAQSSAIILRLKTSVSPVAVVARHWLVLDGSEIGPIDSSAKNRSRNPKARGDCGL